MRLDVKFIAVKGSIKGLDTIGARKDLESFLYDHTKIVTFDAGPLEFGAILRTESELGDENATFLAKYQAGRLYSGLYAAVVGDTIKEVIDKVSGALA